MTSDLMDKIGGMASHLMDEEKGRDNIPRKGRKESPIVSGIKEERKKPACLVVKQAGVPIDRVIGLSKKRILIDQTWSMRRPCGLEKTLVKLASIGQRRHILYFLLRRLSSFLRNLILFLMSLSFGAALEAFCIQKSACS